MGVQIRNILLEDVEAWRRMRQELWPDEEHAAEVAAFFDGDRRNPAEVLLAVEADGGAVGFAEVSIRPYAEGCLTGRIAYLEGWYVEEGHRGRGIGGALVRAVEAWGRAQGCAELGSDAAIDNRRSIAAHRALGFEEVGRVVCFRKALAGGAGSRQGRVLGL